jgi:hypothetical protein
MTTTTARMTVRKGNLADLPKLLPGEFGLAQDIQRLFIGQASVNGTCQVSNSDATTAKVEFTSANGDPIDLDLIANLDQYTYGITVNPASDNISITGNNITFKDAVASFSHGLSSTPTSSTVFELYYNKEVGYHAEAFPNPVQSQSLNKLTADSAGPKESGIEFICANKDKITIDYSLTTTSASRHGQLSILIDDNAGVPTTSSIKDVYDISNGAMPLVFSLSHNSTDKFSLMFDTTDLDTVHTLKYVQKSF